MEQQYTRSFIDNYWNLTPKSVNPAVQGALPGIPFVSRFSGAQATLVFDGTLTAPQVVTLDGVVADLVLDFSALPATKEKKIAAIYARTAELADLGAEFDGNVYASTLEVRQEVLCLEVRGDFPVTVSTADGLVDTVFANAGAFKMFFEAMTDTFRHWQDTGRVLRAAVNAATTIGEVDAVLDDRTWPWVP